MKKAIAWLLSLVLLLSFTPVLADRGSADFTFEGVDYHVVYTGFKIDDKGKLNLYFEGFPEELQINNGKLVILAFAHIIINGKEIESESVSMSISGGHYTYIFDTKKEPDEIILFPNNGSNKGIPVWKKGDPLGGTGPDVEAVPVSEPESDEPEPEKTETSLAESNPATDIGLASGDGLSYVPPYSPSYGIPEELVGKWKGTGAPKKGGPVIHLSAEIRADGSGEYTFDQAGYHEHYSITLSSEDNRFSVDIPKNNTLDISECVGTWALEGGKLTLNIHTTFSSGSFYAYTVECEKDSAEAD